MDFDAHTLRVLEYDKIIALLSERTASALGAERARELLPSPVAAFVHERQQETAEARLLAARHGATTAGRDLRYPSVAGSRRYWPVAFRQRPQRPRLHIDQRLEAQGNADAERRGCPAPLADRAKSIDDFPQLTGDIEIAIGRSGDVLDSASAALAGVRSRLRTVAARITERLTQILNSSTYKTMIQEAVVVMRDDRRCIPIRAEHRREFKGIVHDQSSSGATLFIEPMAVVEMNNELRQLESKERQEIERILAKLTASVGRVGSRIFSTVDVLAAIDLAHAKARLADDLGCMQPSFNRNGVIRLREARHPLLARETVVPVSVNFGDRFKILLITGQTRAARQ